MVLLLLGKGFPVPVLHDIELAAHDGFYLQGSVLVLVFIGFGDELEGAKHITVIGNGQRGHPILYRLFIKALYGGRSVQQRKLGMCMEMGVFRHSELINTQLTNKNVPTSFKKEHNLSTSRSNP